MVSRQQCHIASIQTKGRYRCTRTRLHPGPCAAVPVDSEPSIASVFCVVVIIVVLGLWVGFRW